jgi:hypothetical protein
VKAGRLTALLVEGEGKGSLAITLRTGAGGFGKTRLAAEVCVAARAAGWSSGLLVPQPPAPEEITAIADWPGRLLIAIDYAETRPEIVSALLLALRRRAGRPPARIVLVVRQASDADQLRRLFNPHALEELTDLLRPAEIVRLDRERGEFDRFELFEAACDAFAARSDRPAQPRRPPSLRADHFARRCTCSPPRCWRSTTGPSTSTS